MGPRGFFKAFVTLFLCIVSISAAALTGPEQLQRFLQGLHTMEARFEQSVLNASHTEALRSQGVFYLKRPGRFRWDYHEPYDQLIVADGNRIWMYEPDLEQVSHQDQESALRGTPALLLSDTGPLERHFEIIDLGSKKGFDWVELIPRDRDSEFVRVLLAFSTDQLAGMTPMRISSPVPASPSGPFW